MSKKQALKNSHSEYKRKLESELEVMKTNVKGLGKKALVVGGGALLVYGLVTLLTSKKTDSPDDTSAKIKESKKLKAQVKTKTESNFLSDVVKEQALVFALGLAAKKIGDFLKDLDQKKKQSDS